MLIAHRRAPVLRMIRAGLEAEGFAVEAVATAAACRQALDARSVGALVLDAELLREGVPGGSDLLADLRGAVVPLLLLSWNPTDRLLARSLGDALFSSRPDEIEQVTALVRSLLIPLAPA